jgi:hypothetical protein
VKRDIRAAKEAEEEVAKKSSSCARGASFSPFLLCFAFEVVVVVVCAGASFLSFLSFSPFLSDAVNWSSRVTSNGSGEGDPRLLQR